MRTLSRSAVVALVIAGALVAGCGGLVREAWSKPGASRHDAARDAADCESLARHDPTHGQEQGFYGFSVPRNDRAFDACMRARGYQPVTALRR